MVVVLGSVTYIHLNRCVQLNQHLQQNPKNIWPPALALTTVPWGVKYSNKSSSVQSSGRWKTKRLHPRVSGTQVIQKSVASSHPPRNSKRNHRRENLHHCFRTKKVPNPNRIPSIVFSRGLFAVKLPGVVNSVFGRTCFHHTEGKPYGTCRRKCYIVVGKRCDPLGWSWSVKRATSKTTLKTKKTSGKCGTNWSPYMMPIISWCSFWYCYLSWILFLCNCGNPKWCLKQHIFCFSSQTQWVPLCTHPSKKTNNTFISKPWSRGVCFFSYPLYINIYTWKNINIKYNNI